MPMDDLYICVWSGIAVEMVRGDVVNLVIMDGFGEMNEVFIRRILVGSS